eukprot:TRINITY_DN17900_c0_g1_i1.p1 TRINITY_DN17900_c0_g1~~TRINITY_DN17900_c0_g1_i1.p1  ORF type:complete len:221 (+),score=59.30 TRINITY_DN17900_c0_g1_i1:140-802(+)
MQAAFHRIQTFSKSLLSSQLTRAHMTDASKSPPWRDAIEQSIEKNKELKYSKYVQLATVRPDGRPANRTVVSRGFVDGTDQLQFTADSRSEKMTDVAHQPWGEVCWYFEDTWEQFRLLGLVGVIGCDEEDPCKQEARLKAWQAHSPKSLRQFVDPPPGRPRAPEEEFEGDPPNQEEGPVDTFCLVTLDPKEVDYYSLKEKRRKLYKLGEEGDWSEEEVNP